MYFDNIRGRHGEVRVLIEFKHPEAIFFTFFNLLGPLVAVFYIFYDFLFLEINPIIIKCNP